MFQWVTENAVVPLGKLKCPINLVENRSWQVRIVFLTVLFSSVGRESNLERLPCNLIQYKVTKGLYQLWDQSFGWDGFDGLKIIQKYYFDMKI